MENLRDKLDSLTHTQLIQVIEWTVNDLNNAANHTNYESLDEKVKSWCRMLSEAVKHQVNKAYDRNCKSEEQ